MNTSNFRHSLTREGVLIAFARDMIARTAISQDGFGEALNAAIFQMVPERAADRGYPDLVALTVTADVPAYGRAFKAWSKRVERWLDDEVDLPSWVEEAWVQALDPERRERCVAELAARYGLVAAREAGADGCPVSAFGQLVSRLGDAVTACGVVLADGKIDAQDRPLLPGAIEKLRFVESRAFEIRRGMENELAEGNGGQLRVVS